MWNNVSASGKDLISKLLKKDRTQRMKIDQVLEHPWILGDDRNMQMLRRKSTDQGNKVMRFIAYSNKDIESIK